ncbi:MAG: diadenylate cyclase [Verrucomicrobiota bacterium]
MKVTGYNIIDVTICALMLRFVMGWLFANRQMARLVLKLLLLSGFALLVNRMNLPLSQIMTIYVALPVAILLVIMFLPEIKRAYQVTSFDRLFAPLNSTPSDVIQTLTHTLLEMTQKRCGALIVLPKADDIKALIYGGEEYDSKVTKSLLLSIFNPACPRHDGAVVIQDDRIIQVGAFLPLSTAENFEEEWGTRHLAALGLSERSDARVLVVSEERGEISIARNGKMDVVKNPTPDSLASVINAAMGIETPKEKKKSRRLLAAGLWLIAMVCSISGVTALDYWTKKENAAPDHYRFMVAQAPISFINIPEKFYLEESSTLSCQVYLKFPSEAESLPADFGLAIDLKDYPSGVSTVILTEKMLNSLPPYWEVVRYEPQDIKILLAEAKTMDLAIVPRTTNLAKDLKIASMSVEPVSLNVRVEDRKSTKDRKLDTAYINLSRITRPGEYTFHTTLELPASLRPVVKNADKDINVTLKIQSANP